MALIKCKDCENEISDSAASCPKCGAPVPVTIGVNETQCPHCMTVISKKASTCPSCKAVKGYMYSSSSGAMGKIAVQIWHITLPIILTLSVLINPENKDGWYILIITIPWLLYGIRKLKKGPKWYQRKHV